MERVETDAAPSFSVTADAFTLFNRALAEMTAIGLPLPQAVREIAAGLRGGRFKQGLEKVEAALREGKTLDQAVEEAPGVFPSYYRCMLKAGSASGNLPAILTAVARNCEGIRVARRALLEALIYPSTIVLASFLLGAAALGILVPFYRELSAARNFEAPGLDLFLRAFGSAGLLVAAGAGAVALGVAGFWLLARTLAGERVMRAVPFVGRIRLHLLTSRLLGTLGVMLRAGVTLPRALPVALGAAGSRELDRASETLTAQASEGRGLGDVLSAAPAFSPEVASFLALAERSGDAPDAALKVADVMSEQALSESEALFSLLMPAALLVAGGVVGALVLSVVLPYRQFLESLLR
jgi:type II secretory pathway component PulF